MEERRVGEPNDITRFKFGSSGEGHVLKSGRHGENSRLRKPYAGQRLDQVVPCEGRESTRRARVTGRVRGSDERDIVYSDN